VSIPDTPKKDAYEVTIETHGKGGSRFNVYVGATSLQDAERAALGSVLQPPRNCNVVAVKRLGSLWE
jgi:hypothetical protein